MMNSQNNTTDHRYKLDDEADQFPGFRFHPTDEELVGFYLRRKVDKKKFTIELIKQIDIYKHDPWDLPSMHYIYSTYCLLIFSFFWIKIKSGIIIKTTLFSFDSDFVFTLFLFSLTSETSYESKSMAH